MRALNGQHRTATRLAAVRYVVTSWGQDTHMPGLAPNGIRYNLSQEHDGGHADVMRHWYVTFLQDGVTSGDLARILEAASYVDARANTVGAVVSYRVAHPTMAESWLDAPYWAERGVHG